MSEKIDSAIFWATDQIRNCSESARLDAEILLAHCMDKPRSYLYTWPEKILDDGCWQHFRGLVQQRRKPTPIAYLLGTREFYSMEYAASADALIPRPETELLVDLALSHIRSDTAMKIIDLGTGTGIIAITIQSKRPAIKMTATDLDPACLDLARTNAEHHGVDIEFIQSDWFAQLPATRFDMILSNPPYIAANHPFLKQGDLPAEPSLALTPGQSGLESLQQITRAAPDYLTPGGRILLEHGYDQQAAVADLLQVQGFTGIQCHNDLNDLPRVTAAKLIEKPKPGA